MDLHQQRHQRIQQTYTNARMPYMCEFCGDGYDTWSNYSSHLERVHVPNLKPTDSATCKKAYKCELCFMSVTGGLRTHFRECHKLLYHLPPGDRMHKCLMFDAEQRSLCGRRQHFENHCSHDFLLMSTRLLFNDKLQMTTGGPLFFCSQE